MAFGSGGNSSSNSSNSGGGASGGVGDGHSPAKADDAPPPPRPNLPRLSPSPRLPSFMMDRNGPPRDRLPPLLSRDVGAPTLPSLSSLTDELRDKRPLTRSRSNSLRRAASTSGAQPVGPHPYAYSPSAQWHRGQSEVRSLDTLPLPSHSPARSLHGDDGRPPLLPSSATSWSSASATSLPPLSSITSSLPSPATPTATPTVKRPREWDERGRGWDSHATSSHAAMAPRSRSHSRRGWDELSVGERQEAVQRVLQKFMRKLASSAGTDVASVVDDLFVTVTCSHSGVAQKSYGHEKRFLCPPPIVRVRGPGYTTPSATPDIARQLRMTILPGSQEQAVNELAVSEDVLLDRTLQAKFGHLHVGGSTSSAKTFRLRFDMIATERSGGPSAWKSPRLATSPRLSERYPWLTCESEPISVISKPSKKTTKAKTSSSQITPDLAICLFNRVNSQNVRTKYMAIDDGQLSARNDSWTTFHMRPLSPRNNSTQANAADGSNAAATTTDAVTYGSIVVLEAPGRGAVSDPMVVCKVDKGKIVVPAAFGGSNGAGAPASSSSTSTSSSDTSFDGPISQMQKVAFMRYDGPRHYDSATSASSRRFLCSSPPEPWWNASSDPSQSHAPMRGPSAQAHSQHAREGMVPTPLTFMPPGRGPNEVAPATLNPRDGTHGDVANDAFCWSVVGAAHFDFSFTQMGLSVESASEAAPPLDPPGVLPNLCDVPRILHDAHILRLEGERLAFAPGQCWKVWLGGMGPLPQVSESTSLVAGYGSSTVGAVTVLDVRLPALDALLPYCRSLYDGRSSSDEQVLPTVLPVILVRDADGTMVKTIYSLELFRAEDHHSLAVRLVAG